LPALSLAVGVATLRALRRAGARDIGLKWPNDIWRRDAKLGGVLIELRAEASGPAFVVIGIGLNIILSAGDRREIESNAGPIAALAEACADTPSRNMIAGAVLDETLDVLARFATHGFEPFRDEWLAADVLQGRDVSVLRGERRIAGRARGIDTDGGFLVEVDGTLTKFVSGEVSLRLDPVQP
jgi:BirA family biotin operon repressor/biotin-[acetyl-CoA-carboxylase] ligase